MRAVFTRKHFLESLFGSYYREHRGFILVKSFKRGDPKMSTRYFPDIDILAKEHYGDERDVYFGLCPRERMKAEKEHIRYIVALWADLDIGAEGHEDKQIYFEGPQEAARAIRSFPRAPSIIVESGRGAHLYWLLKEVTEVEDQEKVEGILKKIAETLKIDTDPSLDAVLRLPETVNTKIPGKPVNCDVKFVNPNFRYSLQDFENISERTVARPRGPKAAPPPPPRQEEIVSPPSFSECDTMDRTYEGARDGIDDSLIVDETIIDELIDDISMTATAINEPVSSIEASQVAIESAPRYTPPRSSRPSPVPAHISPAILSGLEPFTVCAGQDHVTVLSGNELLPATGMCVVELNHGETFRESRLDFYEGTRRVGSLKLPTAFASPTRERQLAVETIRSEREIHITVTELDSEFSLSLTIDSPVRDFVNCSIFSPARVTSNTSFLVQVFIYRVEQSELVIAKATARDEVTEERGSTGLGSSLVRGTKLSLALSVKDLSVHDPVQETIWLGEPTSVQFEVFVPPAARPGSFIGTLSVIQDNVPLGKITFKISLDENPSNTDQAPQAVGQALPYELFFISYASKDRPEVIKRVQMLSRLGKRFHQDLLALDPGDRWAGRLYELIDKSDAMLLFWSSNAKSSDWVRREWQYAIDRKGLEFILPVIIEGPPPVDPPSELAELHMNDRLLYFARSD